MTELEVMRFWERFDNYIAKKGDNLTSFTEKTGIKYKTLSMQRMRHSLPNLEQALIMAKYLGISVNELMSGKTDSTAYPKRIQRIIDKCMSAGETDLEIVERVLRIDSEGEKKSDTGSALA